MRGLTWDGVWAGEFTSSTIFPSVHSADVEDLLCSFMAVYVALIWVERAGAIKALGAQAGITWGAVIIVIFLQIFGKRIRRAQGRMRLPGESK